jgi:Rrf2 family protein
MFFDLHQGPVRIIFYHPGIPLPLFCNSNYYSMNNSRFSVSIHILTLLARAGDSLISSDQIAGSINIHPVLVRKELINLRRHKLVATKEGKNGGSYLKKPAGEIYLSDVYKAVYRQTLLIKPKNKANPDCPVGRQIDTHLTRLFNKTEKAILGSLGRTTLKKFTKPFD